MYSKLFCLLVQCSLCFFIHFIGIQELKHLSKRSIFSLVDIMIHITSFPVINSQGPWIDGFISSCGLRICLLLQQFVGCFHLLLFSTTEIPLLPLFIKQQPKMLTLVGALTLQSPIPTNPAWFF